MDFDREYVLGRLRHHSVRHDPAFGFTLASGQQSDLYIDCKATVLQHDCIERIGALLYHLMASTGIAPPNLVAGVPVGGVPLAVTVAMVSDGPQLDIAIVRKAAKDHGTGQMVELPSGAGRRVVLVEDVMTTGGSIIEAIGTLRQAGLEVLGAFVLVDRLEGGAANVLAMTGVRVWSVFTREDLIG